MTNEYRTSRGQLEELRGVLRDLLAAVDHFKDKPTLDPVDIEYIANIRSIRAEILKSYVPEDDHDIYYHCIYKHLENALGKLGEVIESKITYKQPVDNLFEQYKKLNLQVLHVLMLYLLEDPKELEDPECPKCAEDYLAKSQ